jgi:retron-type reverse transcriptase
MIGKNMTRQELYDEIKKTSKDAFILEEMKKLGFWDSKKPSISNEAIKKKVSLQKALSSLSKQIKNPEAVIKDIHQQRMKDALLRREETKAKTEAKIVQKAKDKKIKKENDLGFIGHAFMADIKKQVFKKALVKNYGLFAIEDAKDLASKMGISLRDLRFVTYTQKLSSSSHYVHFSMPKKTGGSREISAPKPKLKALQYWILEHILNKITVNDYAHGFVSKRNILSNALPHVNQSVVINCDVQNFFPSIAYPRVKGLFQSLGYSTEIATLLALISTEAEQKEIQLEGEKLYLYTGKRFLPQGSPASPMISNLICFKLDKRFVGISETLGFAYTRYADDMSFSSKSYKNINKLLYWIHKIVHEEGFILHPDKTRIMRKGVRQEVTGIVVNEKPSLCKKTLKNFRATLYQIEQTGLEGKSWQGKSDNIMASLLGYTHFISMIDKKKGQKYKTQVLALLERYPIEKPKVLARDENIAEEEVKNSKNFLDNILTLFRS